LACDPNYASIGVQPDGSVNTSPEVCTSIQQSCASYLNRTNYFNPLFQAGQAYQRLVNLTRYLRDYKNNNHVIAQDVVLENDILFPTNDTQRTSAVPQNCTNETCDWQCSNFFSPSFVLNESIVANGGGILGGDDVNYTAIGAQVNDTVVPPVNETTVVPPVNETPVVENNTSVNFPETIPLGAGPAGRLLQELQEALWTPDLSGTGLNFNVVDDPADLAAIWNDNPIFDDSSDGPTDGDNTETDNDDFTDNDGINTTETDNDGIDTTGGDDDTDFDGIDTTGNNNNNTDNDGIDTTNWDNTDNDGIDTTGNNQDNTNPTNPTNNNDDDNTNPTNPTNQDDNDDTDN